MYYVVFLITFNKEGDHTEGCYVHFGQNSTKVQEYSFHQEKALPANLITIEEKYARVCVASWVFWKIRLEAINMRTINNIPQTKHCHHAD